MDDGSLINYAEGPDNGKALLLIHGQTGAWQDYTRVLPELSRDWHVFAVDCYGHGGSSHSEEKYYLDENIAAYGGGLVAGAVLEDPPVFSTEESYLKTALHTMIHINQCTNIFIPGKLNVGKPIIYGIACGGVYICLPL